MCSLHMILSISFGFQQSNPKMSITKPGTEFIDNAHR